MTDTPTARDLADSLRATVIDLAGYIENRAKEIAAPIIAQEQAAAAARIAELENERDSERQRREDLASELRRQMAAIEQQNARLRWLIQYLPPRMQGLFGATHSLRKVPESLSPEWIAMVAGLAEEARTGELFSQLTDDQNLLVDAIRMASSREQLSASVIKHELGIGNVPAARMLDRLEQLGVVNPRTGPGTRDVLIKAGDLPGLLDKLGIVTAERIEG